jgi:hypothetical protein
MIAIHEVFVKIESKNRFESLYDKNDFIIIIDEHDSVEVYSLLIKDKCQIQRYAKLNKIVIN